MILHKGQQPFTCQSAAHVVQQTGISVIAQQGQQSVYTCGCQLLAPHSSAPSDWHSP